MPFDPAITTELQKKLDPRHVRQRLGTGGMLLDYLEGWFVIQEANRIFGHDGWTRETLVLEPVGVPVVVKNRAGKDNYKVGYRAVVRVSAQGVVRNGSGFGNGLGPDPVDVHELAIKEAETDAMKRALATFGNVFGLALYDKTRTNVLTEDETRQQQVARLRSFVREIVPAVNEAHDVGELDQLSEKYKTEMQGLKELYPQKYQNLKEKIIAPRRAQLEGDAPAVTRH